MVGGADGVAGVVVVEELIDVVGGAAVVVCAIESGTVIAKLRQSAPAASNAFMNGSSEPLPEEVTSNDLIWLP